MVPVTLINIEDGARGKSPMAPNDENDKSEPQGTKRVAGKK